MKKTLLIILINLIPTLMISYWVGFANFNFNVLEVVSTWEVGQRSWLVVVHLVAQIYATTFSVMLDRRT